MNIARNLGIVAVAMALSGCAGGGIATRLEPMNLGDFGAPATQVASRSYDIRAVQMVVPDELSVSEANSYFPDADIVWRGDPFGDRHEQLRALFQSAADSVAGAVQGSQPVNITLQLVRFHGVTEKTRFSVGGYYAIEFLMTVTDAETGAVIEGPRLVKGSLAAPGGDEALALEHAGQTEKVRVTAYLQELLLNEWAG